MELETEKQEEEGLPDLLDSGLLVLTSALIGLNKFSPITQESTGNERKQTEAKVDSC